MRKHRSWLMGLGIGLILGASMLQLILVAQEQAEEASKLPMTREQLQQEASRLNSVVYSADQRLYTEEQLLAKLEEVKQAKGEPEPETSKEPEPGASKEPEQSAAPKDDEQPMPASEASAEAEPITLYIRPRMTLEEVAQKLEELGLVEDADDFVEKSLSIAKSLDVGTAVFYDKPTYAEIRRELTRAKP